MQEREKGLTADEPADEPMVAAYIIEGAPIIYFGELYFSDLDVEQRTLIFRRALMKVINTKEQKHAFIRIPAAGKGSSVHIDKQVIRGILVTDIDPEDLLEYKDAYVRAFSKLHLAPS